MVKHVDAVELRVSPQYSPLLPKPCSSENNFKNLVLIW
jgi:hypothetical protein